MQRYADDPHSPSLVIEKMWGNFSHYYTQVCGCALGTHGVKHWRCVDRHGVKSNGGCCRWVWVFGGGHVVKQQQRHVRV
jgi:hypothetical protein